MIWIVLLAVFAFFASSGVAYLWWVKVREMRLRQDIFAVRDDLFDAAVTNGWLDDDGYQAFRQYLNSLLAFAHHLSVPVLLHLSNVPVSDDPFPKSENKRIQQVIDQATHDVAIRIAHFVRFETAFGLLVEGASRMARWVRATEQEQISTRIAPGRLPTSVLSVA